MATLDERLKDDDYRHWVKAVLCLQYTKDGLVSFASKKSQDLHNAVLAQMRGSGNPSADGVCSTARIDLRRKAITCCANCNAFLVETKKHCSGTLNLNNTDISNLHDQPWQLAKLFMNPGQDVTNTIPGQTDLSGILNFLDHCTLAKMAILNTAYINAVRDTRNRILHTADMKITKQDFTTNIIPTLTNLLQDPWFLSTDVGAQDAVMKINEIAAADFHITKENEEKVLKDLATEFRCLNKDLNTKIDDLRMDLNKVETNVGQEMKTQQEKIEQEIKDREKDKQMLEKHVETLDQTVKYDTELVTKLGTDVNTVKTSLKETRQGIDKLTSEIKLVEKTCEGKHKILKETCKRKHEEIAADIEYLSKRVKKPETLLITEKDKSELQQYLKDGYDDIKLNVPVLGTCHGIPISEIFAPVILTDTESGQEQESRQPWDAHSHKTSVIEDRRKQRSSASKELRSYKGIFIKENILQKKIFLLGKAGAGKSTFCKHLVDIWSNDNVSPQFDDAEFLKKFRYLFNVSCRFAEASESIFDMICNQLFCENDEMIKVACHVLKNTPDECLVVEDGIDEWKGSARAATGRRGDIAGLPSRKGLEDCVVLSTSRPERIHMLPDKLDKSCSVLELHGIENARQLIYSVLEKAEYTDPGLSCLQFLSQIRQNNMTDMIQCPLMLINALDIWDRNETLSNSMCVNYANMVEGLFIRAKDANRIKAHQQEEGKENSAELPYCFRDTDMCKRNSGLIVRLGKLAFDLLFSDDQNLSLIFSGQQTKKYLTEVELEISLAVGILSKAQTSSRSRRRIDSFSFCHKTFQEFLGALWLSTEQSKVMSMFLWQIRSIHTVLENEVFIQFLCGVSPGFGEEFWKYMAHEVIEKDEEINNLRLKGYSLEDYYFDHTGYMLQNQVLACIKEARSSGGEQHQQLYFFIPDIFYIGDIDIQDAILIDGLVEKYVADIKSVVLYNCSIDSEIVENMKKMKSAIMIAVVYMGDWESSQELKVPVLQFPDQLLTLKMEDVALTTSAVEFPLHLASLTFTNIDLSHSVIEQLFSCLRVSSKLQDLCLWGLHCTDHGHPDCCFPVLDLQKHNSLENVELSRLSVMSMLLPGQETITSQLTKLDIANIKMPHSDIEQLFSCLCVSSNLKCCILSKLCCSDHGDCSLPVLDLQKHNSLEVVYLDKLPIMSVLLLPSQLTELDIANIKMPSSGIEQLFACLCVSSNLKYCSLSKLCCSDHGDCSLPVLDLQKHNSLEEVNLKKLPIMSVLLLPSQLTTLEIADIKMPHSGIEQLFACLCVSSNLKYCTLSELCCSDHGDSCSDHGVRCCFPSLDLQNHHSLAKLTLEQLSVDSVLLPGQRYDPSGIVVMPRLFLKMINVNMSSQSWKRCIDSLPHPSSIDNVSLKYCNIDKDTRSYIRSCSHFIVISDNDSDL